MCYVLCCMYHAVVVWFRCVLVPWPANNDEGESAAMACFQRPSHLPARHLSGTDRARRGGNLLQPGGRNASQADQLHRHLRYLIWHSSFSFNPPSLKHCVWLMFVFGLGKPGSSKNEVLKQCRRWWGAARSGHSKFVIIWSHSSIYDFSSVWNLKISLI